MESKNRLMAPHLQLNTGAQDSLLFDNTRSYFTNVGYTRTSNFQMELRDVDSVTQASLGGKATFTVPKAGDLLGPCDLMVEFEQPSTVDTTAGVTWGWVENVGYAMIEKLQFYVGGSNCVEELTGDQLNIINELMRDEKSRFHHAHTLRTGRPLVRSEVKAETLIATTTASSQASAQATAIVQAAGYTLANSPLTPQVGDLVYMVDGTTTTLIGSLTGVPATRAANLAITEAAAQVGSSKNLEIRRPASHDSFIDTDDDAYVPTAPPAVRTAPPAATAAPHVPPPTADMQQRHPRRHETERADGRRETPATRVARLADEAAEREARRVRQAAEQERRRRRLAADARRAAQATGRQTSRATTAPAASAARAADAPARDARQTGQVAPTYTVPRPQAAPPPPPHMPPPQPRIYDHFLGITQATAGLQVTPEAAAEAMERLRRVGTASYNEAEPPCSMQ